MKRPTFQQVVLILFCLNFLVLLAKQPHHAVALGCTLVIALVINIAIHELGHAIVGFLVGHRVLAIVTGSGPKLLSFKLLGADIEWRLLPGSGYTVLAAGSAVGKTLRFRYAAAVAAGPAASLLVAIVAPLLIPADLGVWIVADGRIGGMSLASATSGLGIWLAITNLFPWPNGTDGSKLLEMMKNSDADIEELGRVLDTTESAYRYREGDFDAAIAASANAEIGSDKALMHTAALCQAGQWAAARDAIERELAHGRLDPKRQALAANNLAWALVHMPDEPGALGKADTWSEFANAHHPGVAAVRSTRARVLAELGRFDNALALLVNAENETGLDPKSRAQIHATRSVAQLGRGNAFDARKEADHARRLDGENAFVVQAALAADEASLRTMVSQLRSTNDGVVFSDAMAGPAGEPLRIAARRWIHAVEPRVAVALIREAGWPTAADDSTIYNDVCELLGFTRAGAS